MRLLFRAISQLSTNSRATQVKTITNSSPYNFNRFLSTNKGNEGDNIDWGSKSTWSSSFTKEHFDGEVVGHKVSGDDGGVTGGIGGGAAGTISSSQLPPASYDTQMKSLRKKASEASRKASEYANKWKERLHETSSLVKQVIETGVRGSYLKDSEKAEIYKLHKENPEVYIVEKLAKDYRIMRQRVHAILWLKEDEEKMEKKLGHPLDDSIELLLGNFPEFFDWHDREFHVATLPYKPDFKVMPEGWDGTIKDPISYIVSYLSFFSRLPLMFFFHVHHMLCSQLSSLLTTSTCIFNYYSSSFS